MNENIDLKRLKEELDALKQVNEYAPGLRRMAKDDVLSDAIKLIAEVEQLRERRYTGVFWLVPAGYDYELLVKGLLRKDQLKITDRQGRTGFILEGLTWDEFCHVQVRRIIK